MRPRRESRAVPEGAVALASTDEEVPVHAEEEHAARQKSRQQTQQSAAPPSSSGRQNVHGEGNYAASKQYNDARAIS
jgi:hypothetical protein